MRIAKKSGRPRAAANISRSQGSSSAAPTKTMPAVAATTAEPSTNGKLTAVSRALRSRWSSEGRRIDRKLRGVGLRDERTTAAVS